MSSLEALTPVMTASQAPGATPSGPWVRSLSFPGNPYGLPTGLVF
jgi:hypothetical protein